MLTQTSIKQQVALSNKCSDGHLLRWRKHADVLNIVSQQDEPACKQWPYMEVGASQNYAESLA